jgi:hypothetical protein
VDHGTTTHTIIVATARSKKFPRICASKRCNHRHRKNIGEIRIFCTHVTFTRVHARKIFSGDAQNFFVRAIAKRVSARRKFFSQAAVFGRPRHAESIKNERISAN